MAFLSKISEIKGNDLFNDYGKKQKKTYMLFIINLLMKKLINAHMTERGKNKISFWHIEYSNIVSWRPKLVTLGRLIGPFKTLGHGMATFRACQPTIVINHNFLK